MLREQNRVRPKTIRALLNRRQNPLLAVRETPALVPGRVRLGQRRDDLGRRVVTLAKGVGDVRARVLVACSRTSMYEPEHSFLRFDGLGFRACGVFQVSKSLTTRLQWLRDAINHRRRQRLVQHRDPQVFDA